MGAPMNFYSGSISSSIDTILFLPLENNYIDSTIRHTFTAFGTVSIDNSQSNIGSGSMLIASGIGSSGSFNGSYLAKDTTVNRSDFSLGTADFVIDCSVRITSLGSTGNFYSDVYSLGSKYGAGPVSNEWTLSLFSDFSNPNWFWTFEYNHAFGTTFSAGSFSPLLNTWYRLTLIRQTTALKLYVNGIQWGSDYNIGTDSLGSNNLNTFYVGGENTSGSIIDNWHGHIDYLIINRNVSTFPSGPPINFYSRSPQSDINNRLYLGLNTDFSDATNRHILGSSGNVTISTTSYIFNGGSAEFGNNGYLSFPSNFDWDLSSYTAWTVNFWIYFKTLAGATSAIYIFSRSLNEEISKSYFLDSTNRGGGLYDFEFTDSLAASGINSGDISLSTGIWYQFTLTKGSANDFNMYINKSLVNSNIFTMTAGTRLDPFIIGAVTALNLNANHDFLIDEFSISDIVRIPGGKPINFYSLP